MIIKELDEAFVAHTYKRFPVEIVSGKGSLLYDAAGKEYIDMGSGIAVSSLGIADEGWIQAVTAQLSLVQHTSNLYYTEPCAALAAELCRRTGLAKVFFGNSGAEANECAIKVARKYAQDKKGADYYNIITLENSFHGRTLTTLAATGQAHYHELFQPLTGGFLHAPANDADALIALARENKVAAIMMEPVQGEGGVYPLSAEFVTRVAAFAKENDILLIFDEVQTGNGRTGSLYAYMQYGVTPDIVTTAKGLGGGLPIGACLLGEKVEGVLGYGDHGSTFGGNPVCAAGALHVLSRIDEELLAEVREKSAYIVKELTGAPGVISVSGMGLMLGIETEKPAADVVALCMAEGVLALTAKHKVRLLPALNIPMDVLEKAVSIIKSALAE
ncbi:MAG: acetylornithine/succinylornithine family transaminase [Clostridia bacterium]|nr:acetylornithine/succinylornithine family transaminase [Clostridia bacterium]